MRFFAALKNSSKVRNLETRAHDVLTLPKNLRALRVDDDVYVVNEKDKIVDTLSDTFPSNPARATYQLAKKLKLASDYSEYKEAVDKKNVQDKNVWTCGFRENEERWVWYQNSEPRMTVSFKEAYPDVEYSNEQDLESKIDFCAASYGTQIVETIKQDGLEKTAEKIHGLVLENSYVTIRCTSCQTEDNYTIDDLVDDKKVAKYDSNFVVCSECSELIRLMD